MSQQHLLFYPLVKKICDDVMHDFPKQNSNSIHLKRAQAQNLLRFWMMDDMLSSLHGQVLTCTCGPSDRQYSWTMGSEKFLSLCSDFKYIIVSIFNGSVYDIMYHRSSNPQILLHVYVEKFYSYTVALFAHIRFFFHMFWLLGKSPPGLNPNTVNYPSV